LKRSLRVRDHRWFKRSTREKKPVTRDNNNNIIIRFTTTGNYTGNFTYKTKGTAVCVGIVVDSRISGINSL
jgi:hypothetical protein